MAQFTSIVILTSPLDIHDPNIMDTLTVNFKKNIMNSKIDTREIVVIYWVYYKKIKTTISPKAINSSVKGVTMIMEANKEQSTTFVPRLLNWDEIHSDEDWKFESITKPLPI